MNEPTIFQPSDWGAVKEPTRKGVSLNLPVSKVIIHTFAGASFEGKPVSEVKAYIRAIERFHTNPKSKNGRGWAAIGYNFMVSESGDIYVGRGWKRSAAHTAGQNRSSIGISLVGHGDKNPATEAQIASTQWLIQEGIKNGSLSKDLEVFGHRQFAAKSCPGNLIYPLVADGTFLKAPEEPEPEVKPISDSFGSYGRTIEDFVTNAYLVHNGRFPKPEDIIWWSENYPDPVEMETAIASLEEAQSRLDDAVWLDFVLKQTNSQYRLSQKDILSELVANRLSRLDVVDAIKHAAILTKAAPSPDESTDKITESVITQILDRLNNG